MSNTVDATNAASDVKTETRVLARVVARELTPEEVEGVGGGGACQAGHGSDIIASEN